ncbi:hypothetical protein BGS_0766 [Beggiatoa sp. SS]|nr:hypothetical protein BGS_0766 [Beggiatoa sp. SS]
MTLGEGVTFVQLDCVNGLEINPQGESLDSQTCFTSQVETGEGVEQLEPITLTNAQAQALRIQTTLTLAQAHVGKPAALLIVGIYETSNFQAAYLRVGDEWMPWHGELGDLQAAEFYSALPDELKIQVFEGDLSAVTGELTVFVGYRLEDGTLICNADRPIQINILP